MSDVVSVLEECGALLTGHFLLSSGKHSSQYFQCARLLQFPDRASKVISSITEKITCDNNISQANSVIGPAMGGIIVAYELGRQLGLPSFFTERDEDGKMTLRRGFEIAPGEKIIIAEDVVTTGKSALETAERIKDMGGQVIASVCIVDRRPESAENPFPWPLFSAVRIPAVLFDPAGCPLCREGKLPPVKPGSRKVF